MKDYYIIKKNIDGIYLLDPRNTMLLNTCDKSTAIESFSTISSKEIKSSKLYLVYKSKDDKFLTMLKQY